MRRRCALGLVVLSPALLAGGCRYTAGGGLPPEVKTIGVTMLRNETRFPGLEGEVTRAVINALGTGGRLKVIDAEDEPDLVLTGRVTSCWRRSVRTDRYGDPVRFSVVVEARVSLRDADGEYLFRKLAVTNRALDPESGGVDLGRGQTERQGRARAVVDLGRNITRRIVDGGW